jgi:hypothetical protein
MSITNHWRNKQLGSEVAFLKQELICFNFLKKHKNLTWGWYGFDSGNFYNHCKKHFDINKNKANGLVIINFPSRVSPKEFTNKINSLIDKKICAVYLAINRYEFINHNDLNINYKDNIAESIQQIVKYIQLPLTAIDIDNDVDGKHFVGVHGLDIFKYENNQ